MPEKEMDVNIGVYKKQKGKGRKKRKFLSAGVYGFGNFYISDIFSELVFG